MIHNIFLLVIRVPNGYIAGGTPDSIKQGSVLSYNCDPGLQTLLKN